MVNKLIIADIPASVEMQKKLTDLHIEEWLREDVLHYRWWILLGLIILLYAVWWISIDKSRISSVCLYVALAAVLFMGINEYSEELTLWDYPTDIIAIFPPLSSINLISYPLIYSLLYQRFKTRNSFILAVIITTAIICFIVEPLLSWGDIIHLLKWKYYYNYPIYSFVALFIRAVVNKIIKITESRNLIWR